MKTIPVALNQIIARRNQLGKGGIIPVPVNKISKKLLKKIEKDNDELIKKFAGMPKCYTNQKSPILDKLLELNRKITGYHRRLIDNIIKKQ